MSEGRVDVVIVTFQSEEHIGRAVTSALAIEGLGKVVVVDHGRDGSADIASGLGAEVVRDDGNPGFGAGQNRGVALTDAPLVLLLNPDAAVVPDGVGKGIDLLQSQPGVAAVQGVIRSAEGIVERSQGVEVGPVHLWGRALGLRRLLSSARIRRLGSMVRPLRDHAERVPDRPAEVESLAAVALLVRRTAFDDVAGFDRRFFLYGEDLDLCHRLRQKGWSLVAIPDAWGLHAGGSSSATWVARERAWWEGTLLFAARWWSSPAWACGWLAAVPMTIRLAVADPLSARRSVSHLLVRPYLARRHLA